MSYEVIIPKKVAKQIRALPANISRKILSSLSSLEQNPRPNDVKKLKGYDQTYRIRVGDYRVVYDIEDNKLIVLILSCRHRKNVYKKF